MQRPSPMLFAVATATLMLGRPAALPAADLDSDALARTLRRPDPICSLTEGSAVLDSQDVHWLEVPESHPIGVFGNVLTSEPEDRLEARRLVFGAAQSAQGIGRPNDIFGVMSALDRTRDRRELILRDGEIDEWTLMGFYSAEIASQIHLQPSIGLHSDAVPENAEFIGLFGLQLTY